MKALLKNWLLPINSNSFFIKKQKALLCLLFFCCLKNSGQIANYVRNGGFDTLYDCTPQNPFLLKIKHWSGIDTIKNAFYSYDYCMSNVPTNGGGFQYPKQGTGYIQGTFLCDVGVCSPIYNRSYFRNKLKSNLVSGKTYCVKYHVSIINQSAYGIDGFGAWFADNIIDTIHYGSRPLTYITPQIQNPAGNIITDTLNWALITSTFVANGTEKYMVLGNFKTDANTMTSQIQSTVSYKWCDIYVDAVSCIPLDLPAYAGADVWGIPSNTVYIGRPSDVGIDEACMWYKLPNTTTAIDTVAGITVTVAATTQTYMVKQDICGVIKYDTVVVYASGVGLNELKIKDEGLKIFPNPTSNELNIEFVNSQSTNSNYQLSIINSFGQTVINSNLKLLNNKTQIDTKGLGSGIFLLQLKDSEANVIEKRFVVIN